MSTPVKLTKAAVLRGLTKARACRKARQWLQRRPGTVRQALVALRRGGIKGNHGGWCGYGGNVSEWECWLIATLELHHLPIRPSVSTMMARMGERWGHRVYRVPRKKTGWSR